jgi:hypothetical protein
MKAQIFVEFFDTYDKLIPCYDIEPVEKITDAVRAFSLSSENITHMSSLVLGPILVLRSGQARPVPSMDQTC